MNKYRSIKPLFCQIRGGCHPINPCFADAIWHHLRHLLRLLSSWAEHIQV